MGVSGEGVYHARLPRSCKEGLRPASRRSFGAPASWPAQYESYYMALLSMRLPPFLLSNTYFQFSRIEELITALGDEVGDIEKSEIQRLHEIHLPPIISSSVLAAIFGINPGIVWSLLNKKQRYYRRFTIPKGKGRRVIQAPRVVLKIIQKWLSVRLACAWQPNDCVYGFVSGRSHIDAAARHCGADWVFSCDIENFFSSTPEMYVASSLQGIGYGEEASELISSLSCYEGGLAQGSPASPVLSNICAVGLDNQLIGVRDKYDCVYTRYADDVVFSGVGEFPEGLDQEVLKCFAGLPWKIAKDKTKKSIPPERLKVHGLLVDQATPRLTKGYRNRIRAYRHLVENNKVTKDTSIIKGHLAYADSVERYAEGD